MAEHRIGAVAKALTVSVDTLRYYEKCGLVPRVARDAARSRVYAEKDISRLKFIRRAQQMNFSLAEIRELLELREDPQHVRAEVSELAARKLRDIEEQLDDLTTLRNELTLLLYPCRNTRAARFSKVWMKDLGGQLKNVTRRPKVKKNDNRPRKTFLSWP